MSLDAAVGEIDNQIRAIFSQHASTRRKTLKQLRDVKGASNTQQLIYSAIIAGVEHLIANNEAQKKKSKRFESIPKLFPAPNPNSELDRLIYSRMIMGYTMMPSGRGGGRLKTALKNIKERERYVAYLQKHATTNSLGQDNFHHLCRVGCPQATHEWMYVHDLPAHVYIDKSVIAESKRLLAEYGY